MEHWFDRATRFLATGTLSRRDALKSLALGAVGTVLPQYSSARPVPGGAQNLPVPPLPGAQTVCTRQMQRGERITTLSAVGNYRGRSLTLRSVWTSVGSRFINGRLNQRVDLGGYLVYDLSLHFDPSLRHPVRAEGKPSMAPVVSADVHYGPVVRGPRHLHLTANGNDVRGFADGQPICDGELSEPLGAVDQALRQSVQALAAAATRSLSECRELTTTPGTPIRSNILLPPVRVHPAAESFSREIGGTEASPLTLASLELANPLEPMQGRGTACAACLNGCQNVVFGCLGVDALAWILNPIAGFTGLAGCGTNYINCEINCSQPGAACCSVSCGEAFCCGSGQTCCGPISNPGGPACCNSGSVCTTVTDPLYGPVSYCCPGGSDRNGCVGGNPGEYWYLCRMPGQVCCGLFGACPEGEFCGSAWADLCCPNGQVACDTGWYYRGVPIPQCCNGTCLTYNPGTNAQYQVCCPSANVCGNRCCQPNEHCLPNSKQEKVCCDQETLCGDVCCDWPATCVNGVCGVGPCGNTFCGLFIPCCNGVCCPLNATCTNGQCIPTTCPAGEVPCPYTPGQCCPPGFLCCGTNQCCDPSKTECCGAKGCVPIGECIIVN